MFHNMCRHRGAQLVSRQGCSKRISCPYHAWSYATDGKLLSVPGKSQCFPNLDKQQNGLLEVPCIEKYGFIWAHPQESQKIEETLDAHLEGVGPALAHLEIDKFALFKRHTKTWNANWKIATEGGIETYHFSYAHSSTIGPSFMNNTAVIDVQGNHLRVVMPTKSLSEVATRPLEQQHIRECSHILHLLFPTSALLVQHNHIDWIYFRPVAVDKTEIHIASLVPADQLESRADHWQRNHEITLKVLDEDFILGEGIQASMNLGVMPQINYGRNEWALKHLNNLINQYL